VGYRECEKERKGRGGGRREEKEDLVKQTRTTEKLKYFWAFFCSSKATLTKIASRASFLQIFRKIPAPLACLQSPPSLPPASLQPPSSTYL
jgi:hypothetical protein